MFVYGSLFTLCGHQFSMWFTCCSSLEDFPFWPTLFDLDIFYPVYLNSYTSVSSYHSLWLLLGLRFPKGQDTLVSFLLLPVVHEHAKFLATVWKIWKISVLKTSLLSQQYVMMSKCHMICTNYITHITSIKVSWYNLSQNRLKSNRFYST